MIDIDIPFDTVEDAPSRRRFAHLMRHILTEGPPDNPLPYFEGLRGFSMAGKIALETYQTKGRMGVLALLHSIAHVHPPLMRDLFETPDLTDALPSLRILRHSELAMLPPVSFLDVDRLIQDNGISMIVGKPGSGKSLWALGKAHEVGQRLPVLYVAAEAQASLYDRQLAVAQARGCPMPENVYTCIQPVNLRLPEQVQALTDYAGDIGARLVIFDTWAACTAGADENSTRDVQPIFSTLEQFKADLGCGILLIHHTRKDSAVYRGSSAIQGALDNMYVLTEDDGLLTLKAEKTRDSRKPDVQYFRIAEYATRTDPTTGEPVHAAALLPSLRPVQSEADGPKPLQGNPRKVLEALQAYEEGLTAKALMAVTDIPKTTLHNLLNELKECGYVAAEKHTGHEAIHCLTEEGKAKLA